MRSLQEDGLQVRGTSQAIQSLALMAFVLVSVGCSGASRGTQPNEMSYEDHLIAAEQDEGTAQRYDDRANRGSFGENGNSNYQSSVGQADTYRSQARAHRQAADVLSEQHNTACTDISSESHEVCPLAGADEVVSVDDVPGGVLIELSTDEVARVRQAVECHVSHSAYVGFEGMEGCVFSLQDSTVDVSVTGDGRTQLLITSTDPEVVEEIRARTRRAEQSDVSTVTSESVEQ